MPGNVYGVVELRKTTAREEGRALLQEMRLINFNRLKAWLHTCLTDHVHQEPEAASSIANLRVIDCHHSGRVVVPAPTECEYVALSYVWGVQGPGNFEDADGFPPTVMDAVIATKKLGYRYLWVDRYVSEVGCAASQS